MRARSAKRDFAPSSRSAGASQSPMRTSLWSGRSFAVSAWLVIVFRTKKEEENLIARFGDEYRSYMERTGRFFPGQRASGRAPSGA